MKTFYSVLFSLSLILISSNLKSQSFAPLDATWHYEIRYAFAGDINYTVFSSVGDTLINGRNCQTIEKSQTIQCYNELGVEYVYSSNDSVYYYNELFDSFFLLYDFNAKQGEKWRVYRSNTTATLDTVQVEVNLVSTTQINGQLLKTLDVTYTDWSGTYQSTIIELLGDLKYMFPWFPSNAICDIDYSAGLRCYDDPTLGFHSLGIADSCTYRYVVGISENDFENDLSIYPNPSSENIIVECDRFDNGMLEIFNHLHQKVFFCNFDGKVNLNTTGFSPGIYYVRLRQDGNAIHQRFVKN